MAAPSPLVTPKRKRGDNIPISPVKFSFSLSRADTPDDESNSPQSNVTHRFRALGLGSGGGVPTCDNGDDSDDTEAARKRQKPDEVMTDAAVEDLQKANDSPLPNAAPVAAIESKLADAEVAPLVQDAAGSAGAGPPRSRRAGTPPLKLKKSPRRSKKGTSSIKEIADDIADEDDGIVDPIRAALTWHEDEITIYDPDDEDDDGTGINGVGFKPTAAIAHARCMRRRQQMAEYRKREEGEARAKRNQRRRGEEPSTSRAKKSSPRRVRFMDSERPTLPVTTV